MFQIKLSEMVLGLWSKDNIQQSMSKSVDRISQSMGFIGPESFNTTPEGLSPQTALHTFMPYNLAYTRLFISDYETTSLGGSSITVVLCQPFWTEKTKNH